MHLIKNVDVTEFLRLLTLTVLLKEPPMPATLSMHIQGNKANSFQNSTEATIFIKPI